MTPKNIAVAEYNSYYTDDQDFVWKYDINMKLFNTGVKATQMACGLQNCACVYNGKVTLIFPDGSNKPISISDAVYVSGMWTQGGVDTFAVARKSGLSCFDPSGNIVNLVVPAGVTFTKLSTTWRLSALDSNGGIWEYYWSDGSPNKVLPLQKIAVLDPVPVKLKASDIASSKSMHSTAIVDGVVYGWCEPFGSGFIGLDFQLRVSTPVNLSAKWGLTKKVLSIASNDNTTHFITEDFHLWGLGANEQGEVGNGQRAQSVITSGGWNLADYTLWVKKPYDISAVNGRLYDKIVKGPYMSYTTYVRETNGMWSSCGARIKGGVNGAGIWKSDDNNINLLDVPTFRRVNFPAQGIRVADESFFKDPSKYPVPEPLDAKPPAPPIVTEHTFVIDGKTYILYSDKTWK